MTSPLVVGTCILSITVFGSILLYLYNENKKDKDPRITQIKRSRQSIIEIKIPTIHVTKIIGRRGNRVKEIQNTTQTQIFFQEDNCDELNKVCVIKGKPESVILAESIIRNIISSQPEEKSHIMYIPDDAVGRLIGIGGRNIRKIQKDTNTKINFDSVNKIIDSVQHQQITILGTAEQIEMCVSFIEQEIQEDELNQYSEDIRQKIVSEKKLGIKNNK